MATITGSPGADTVDEWHWKALAGFSVATAIAWAVGGLSALSAAEQYTNLERPSWGPPPAAFGPVWTVLYIMIAVSAWFAWRAAGGSWTRGHGAWVAQLVLNAIWTPLFFSAGLFGVALLDIVTLAVLIVVTIALFWRESRLAALLLVPYLAWVCFASALNYSIWAMN